MSISTQIVLVRHGQTNATKNHRIHGQTDSPLSVEGIQEARKTADHFRGQHFDALYSSPLGRAMHTAEIIADAIKLTPIPEEGFMEQHYGWLEGKSMKLFDPDLSGPKITRPIVKFAMKMSGEDSGAFVERIICAFDRIAEKHKGGRVLIVLHWMPISIGYLHALGKDVSKYREIGPWTACGISEFHSKNYKWELDLLDKSSHLLKNTFTSR
jgi:broad specificity phosphatase PhoE